MSSFLKIHELVKSAALFTLCSLLLLACIPAQAAESPDTANSAYQLLVNIGAGFLWYCFLILAFVLVCSFSEGQSRDRAEREARENKLTDDKTKQG